MPRLKLEPQLQYLVLSFFLRRRSGERFYLNDLAKSVSMWRHVAPDSPGRIMRDLRRSGKINYRVINRGKSLYEVVRHIKLDWD